MEIIRRVNAFLKLGETLGRMDESQLSEVIAKAQYHNRWFTEENIKLAFEGIQHYLNEEDLNKWVSQYPLNDNPNPKKTGIIMAGNIPMVGFHDLLCVLMSGHRAIIKLSSQDDKLLPFITDLLIKIEPSFAEQIVYAEQLQGIDAVIATGSNNTARYFNYYFKHIPHIIRKNRTSVAVIDGKDSDEALSKLGYDFFQYFGLGCRNVSKVYLPEGFDITKLLDAIMDWEHLVDHHKYINNFNYNRAIYAMEQIKHLDTGFALFTENENIVSPTSIIYYEYYKDEAYLYKKLSMNKDDIQCVVANNAWVANSKPFGMAQKPDVWDYSDDIDTMAFLTKL